MASSSLLDELRRARVRWFGASSPRIYPLLAVAACGEVSAPPVSFAPPPLDADLVLEWPMYRVVAADAEGTAKVVFRDVKTGLGSVATRARAGSSDEPTARFATHGGRTPRTPTGSGTSWWGRGDRHAKEASRDSSCSPRETRSRSSCSRARRRSPLWIGLGARLSSRIRAPVRRRCTSRQRSGSFRRSTPVAADSPTESNSSPIPRAQRRLRGEPLEGARVRCYPGRRRTRRDRSEAADRPAQTDSAVGVGREPADVRRALRPLECRRDGARSGSRRLDRRAEGGGCARRP